MCPSLECQWRVGKRLPAHLRDGPRKFSIQTLPGGLKSPGQGHLMAFRGQGLYLEVWMPFWCCHFLAV